MYKKIILLLTLTVSASTFAQEQSYSFNLQEAINFALENNRTAINASQDVEAAEKQKWETISTGLPQISANIDYQNWIQQQVALIPAEFFGGNPGDFAEIVFGTKQTMNASARLEQKIFDGSYIVGLQSTKVYLDISNNAKVKTDLEVRKAVINAYGNVLLAEESVIILERNQAALQKNLSEITKIYENGLEEEESVEQLQITLSNVENALKNTKRLKDLAYQMLNITLGIDLNASLTLTDNLESLTNQFTVLSLLESDENVENTIDYLIAENDLKSKELLVKLQKSKALPTINAFLSGSYAGYSDQFTFTNKSERWFGASLLGVNMNIPIFSFGGRGASTQRAKINLEKAKNELTETEQKLKLQIASAKSEYQFAIEDHENKTQNLKLAERIEAKNQTKFFEGIASSFDLRQAQLQLYTAQQEYLKSMFDVITKKTELETILNTPSY